MFLIGAHHLQLLDAKEMQKSEEVIQELASESSRSTFFSVFLCAIRMCVCVCCEFHISLCDVCVCV